VHSGKAGKCQLKSKKVKEKPKEHTRRPKRTEDIALIGWLMKFTGAIRA